MSLVLKPDGYTDVVNDSLQQALLWVTTTSGSAGDWIAEYTTDTTNPAGVTGESFRTAASGNADALYGTCAVAAVAWSAAGYVPCYIRGFCTANVDSGAAVAIGDDLSVGATAGRAIEYTGTNPDLRVIGRCLSTPSGNLASVEVYPHPRFSSL